MDPINPTLRSAPGGSGIRTASSAPVSERQTGFPFAASVNRDTILECEKIGLSINEFAALALGARGSGSHWQKKRQNKGSALLPEYLSAKSAINPRKIKGMLKGKDIASPVSLKVYRNSCFAFFFESISNLPILFNIRGNFFNSLA